MTLYRRPTALVREVIRRRPRNLTLAALTGGFESDLLVGAGCLSTSRTCYFGLEIFGFAPMYTQAELRVVDESESTICGSFRGSVQVRTLVDTDLLRNRPDIRVEGGVVHYPPIEIDVALIHVLEADAEGNARFIGNLACDREFASKSKRTIVSAERIVDHIEEPTINADVVVHAPRGSWPASCYPDYPVDGLEILRYIRACEKGRFEEYLAEFLSR